MAPSSIQIRRRLLGPYLQIDLAAGPVVTASFGVYVIRDLSAETMGEIIAQADSNLYKAKQAGKNRVACS